MKRPKEIEWSRLDNASKFFPATCNGRDPKVFRLSCELYEPVEPEFLQTALERTLDNFPLYRSVLRSGLFWYYLELSELRPLVEMESKSVCAPIYLGRKNNLLFRVIYFKCRISLEVFHALSDGTGAAWFLQMMVIHYLTFKYGIGFSQTEFAAYQSAVSRQMDDSFQKHSIGGIFPQIGMPNAKRIKNAYRIRGTRLPENRLRLIEGAMSVQDVLAAAHKHDTTLSVFVVSLLIYAIYKEMPAQKKKCPIILSVPINLRQFFESASMRNFFCTMNVGYRVTQGAQGLDAVIQEIGKSFEKNLTEEQLNRRLNQFVFLERNPLTRIIPLPWKNMIIRIAAKLANRQVTSAVSNVGRLAMPPEFQTFIRRFSVCISARVPRLVLCSCGDRIVMSFTSPFRETDIQKTFFQLLSELGTEIEITSNL